MPFTFSHPAAILPAKYLPEKWVSLTALVIGSITPDFEYFIRMANLSNYSHTWGGLFWFDLPVGFALTFIYHYLVRNALIDNLPRIFRIRLTRFTHFDWWSYVKQHYIVVIVCLAVGSATHIAWDGFTHRTGCFIPFFPWLLNNTEVFGVNHARFYILQNISSAVGGLVVLYALLKIPADKTIPKRNIMTYWVVVALIAIVITIIRGYIGLGHIPIEAMKRMMTPDFYTVFFNSDKAEDTVMTVISASLQALVITPFILKISFPATKTLNH
jgi:hypothetical protein